MQNAKQQSRSNLGTDTSDSEMLEAARFTIYGGLAQLAAVNAPLSGQVPQTGGAYRQAAGLTSWNLVPRALDPWRLKGASAR
jgi:hypothetical protein